jgi:hypothetical protein
LHFLFLTKQSAKSNWSTFMTTQATALFPRDLDVLLVFAARANDAINSGDVRYSLWTDYATTVAALRRHMPSLEGFTLSPRSMTIVATKPACKALYKMLGGSSGTSFDAAILHVRKALQDTLFMFLEPCLVWRAHPAFAGREQEWAFLGSDYVALDWLVADTPFRFKFLDTRTGHSQPPEQCTSGAAARHLARGGLAFLVPFGDSGLALVCPGAYVSRLKAHYDRCIVAATMLIARFGFLRRDFGFRMTPIGTAAKGLLELFKLCSAAGLDVPQNMDQTLAAYHQAFENPDDAARKSQLHKQCIQVLLEYSRPWLHEADHDVASLFRGWMVTVSETALVERGAIVCPGATISDGCRIFARAIVRNGAFVAPNSVLGAGELITASPKLPHAVSGGDGAARTQYPGPGVLIPTRHNSAFMTRANLAMPFTNAAATARYPAMSPGMAQSPGRAPSWRCVDAGDLAFGDAESSTQNTMVPPPLSTTASCTNTSTTTTTTTTTTPPFTRKRPRPGSGTQSDDAPPSSRQRTTPPGWVSPGANAWPYPEVDRAHPRRFTWIEDPSAMPYPQTSRLPAPPFASTYPAHVATSVPLQEPRHPSQNLQSGMPLLLPPRWMAPAGAGRSLRGHFEQRDLGFEMGASLPIMRNRELPTWQATPTVEHTFLSNEILQLARVPLPTYIAVPALYSGRGNTRAAPNDDAPHAAPLQPSLAVNESALLANRVGPSAPMPRPVARKLMFKHS